MSWWISRTTLCTGESLAGGAGGEAKPRVHREMLEVQSAH